MIRVENTLDLLDGTILMIESGRFICEPLDPT